MSKEIIDLLEKINDRICLTCEKCFSPDCLTKNNCPYKKLFEEFNQALTLLKQPVKQYLPSELIKDNNFVCQNCHHVHEMGGYKVVKQQPPAGEFTKNFREQIQRQVVGIGSIGTIREMSIKACDIIDRAEVQALTSGNSEQLGQIEQLREENHKLKVRLLKQQPPEAAIEKAKE